MKSFSINLRSAWKNFFPLLSQFFIFVYSFLSDNGRKKLIVFKSNNSFPAPLETLDSSCNHYPTTCPKKEIENFCLQFIFIRYNLTHIEWKYNGEKKRKNIFWICLWKHKIMMKRISDRNIVQSSVKLETKLIFARWNWGKGGN